MKRFISLILTIVLLCSAVYTNVSALTVSPQIAAGSELSLILKADGSLWILGWYKGKKYEKPYKIGTGFRQIAVGYSSGMALKGTDLYIWYLSSYYGSPQSPEKIGTGFTAISAGGSHMLALKGSDLYAWGDNTYGQLGDGTTTNRNIPTKIGTGYTAIAAGKSHSLALKGADLYAWGLNTYGQLGDGTFKNRLSPRKVKGTGFTTISAGSRHSLALKGSDLYEWGRPNYADRGNTETTPQKIGTGFTAISAGGSYNLALKNKDLYAWGNNYGAQLGIAQNRPTSSPQKIATGFTKISATHLTGPNPNAITAGGVCSLGLKGSDVYITGYRPGSPSSIEEEKAYWQNAYKQWTKISVR